MRIAKVMLGLSGVLLMSLVLVSFQAAAHPDASDGGIAEARGQAGTDPPGYGLCTAGWCTGGPMDQQIAHNPLCSAHDV